MYFLFRNKIFFKSIVSTVLNTFKKKYLNSILNTLFGILPKSQNIIGKRVSTQF